MDNKTNRGKLVRKYIGEEIEKFKFEYKGYQNDSWKYERKFKGVMTEMKQVLMQRKKQ